MNTNKIIIISLIILSAIAIGFFGWRFFANKGAWLCQNGEWVKQGNPSSSKPTAGCGQAEADKEIVVDSPRPGQTVTSPFLLKGKASGNWYFEASFPVRLLNNKGNELLVQPVQAIGDWMTADFVPFEQLIEYHVSATTSATLVLQNDNPSGLPELAKEIRIPLNLSPTNNIKLKIFFNNNNLDPEITCTKVFAADRQVPKTEAVARVALEQLLAGPSQREKAQGYSTSINPGVKIQKLEITNGAAKVDFNEVLDQAVGGSCRVTAIRAQITETLKQFATVKNVIISINGRTEDILQP